MPKKISELPATGKVSDSDLLEASRDPHGVGDSVHMPIGMLRLFMADPAGDWRNSVRFRTIGNVDLATGLADGSTHDGVTGATGDRALVPDQTDASQNGVYELQASGAAVRVADFDADAEVLNGAIFYVREGTVHKGTAWIVDSADPHVVGTDDITFAAHAPALGGSVAVHEAGTPVVSAATILNMLSSTVVDAGGGQANITPDSGGGGGGGGAGGGLVEIASKDFGAGSATEWDVDVTGYDQVFVYASDTPTLLVRTSTDGTNFADTSGDYHRAFVNDATNNTSNTILGFQISDESADTSQVFAVASLSNLSSAEIETMWLMHGFNDGTSGFAAIVEAFRNAKEVNTHIRFVNFAGGSIAAGVVRVMGIGAGGGQAGGTEEIAFHDFGVTSQAQLDVDVTGFDKVTVTFHDVSVTSGGPLALQLGTDASTFATGASDYLRNRLDPSNQDVASDDRIALGEAHASGLYGVFEVVDLASADLKTQVAGVGNNSGVNEGTHRSGIRQTAEVNTHIRILDFTDTTITAGKVRVTGIRSAGSAGAGRTELTIANNDFASGDLTSWTTETGGFTVAATSPEGGEAPRFGSNLAHANANASNVIYQDIDISGHASRIDADEFHLGVICHYQHTFEDGDRLFIDIDWLDGADASLRLDRQAASVFSDGQSNAVDEWHMAYIRFIAPANARKARLKLRADRADSGSTVHIEIDQVRAFAE